MGNPRRSLICFPIVLLLAAPAAGQRAEPVSSPILRIEMGGHADRIGASAVDASGRFLATASDDKTARLWDIASGERIAVFRPPSDNATGKLEGVAVTRNADRIIVGGETDERWYGGNAAFVFDRQGRLLRVVEGIRGRITGIAVTPDEKMLVVGTISNIQIFDLGDYSPVASASARVYRGLAVSSTGAIAYTAYVGRLDTLNLCQLSGRSLSCGRKVTTREGYYFSPPAFSEDGGSVASAEVHRISDEKAADKKPVVRLYSVPELNEVRTLSTDRLRSNLIGPMSWTRGDCLIASSLGRVRVWRTAGDESFQDIPIPFGFAAIHQAGSCAAYLLTNATEAALYRIDANSESAGVPLLKARLQTPSAWRGPVGDWRAVPIPRPGTAPVPTFHLKDRTIEGTVPQSRDVFRAYTMADPAQLARNLRENRGLDQVYNLFVLEDRSAVLVFLEDQVELVTAEGKVSWSVPSPSRAYRIGLSTDRKVVACFFADGVVRWYRFSDGREFLAGYLHPDEKRWVLWTPVRLYDAGPGGEELIRWQVNKCGRLKAADFFPVSRFRQTFYRPDVIDQVLDSLDEKQAIVLAGNKSKASEQQASVEKLLPPIVEIILPASPAGTSTASVKVRISVRTSKDAPATSIRVRVNGRNVKVDVARDLVLERTDGDIRELDVPVPPEDSDILIFAENKNGVSSPAILPVKWRGRRVEAPAGAGAERPKLYLLAIGVSDYVNPQYRLEFAAKDARDFAAAFAGQKAKLYRDVEARILTDRKATRDAVLDGLEWLQRQVTARDVGVLFLAGHGINTSDGVYYFAPAEFDLNAVKRTGVVFSEIKNTLAGLAGKALFFVDTCHSGNVLGGRRALPDVNAIVNELSSAENGVVVFSSATGREAAFENADWGNGAFTKALIEGLTGKADYTQSGRVTHRSLDLYLSERVKQLTGGRQHPVTQAPGGAPDFPIALVGR